MTDRVNRAFLFALNVHGGQIRKDGKPYITHPFGGDGACPKRSER